MKKKLQNHFFNGLPILYTRGLLLLTMTAILGFSNAYSQIIVKAQGENVPAGEVIGKLIDNDKNSKWLDFSRTSWVVFQFAKDTVWNKYQITSGNDAPERDPKDWTIQASNDSITWINLDTVAKQSWSVRNQTRFFSFTNTTKYKYYRWNITANGSGDIIQASEFSFSYSTDFTAPAAPTTTTATNITENGVTLSWSASLDSLSVAQYEVYKGDTLIANTPTKSVAITGLSASTMYKFLIRATDSAGNTSLKYDSISVRTGERSDTVKVRSILISTLADTANFQVGDTIRLVANITPQNASNKNITWSVNDETGSAIIGETTGVLIATKAGRISVEAVAQDELGIASSPFIINIKADAVKVRSITITTQRDTSDFKVGDTIRFTANTFPLNASNKSVTWRVQNETGSAVIDSTGRLVARTRGFVSVFAKSKDSLGIESSSFILIIDPSIITSTVQENLDASIIVSPNPSNGIFNIYAENTNTSFQANVYNGNGVLVLSATQNGFANTSLDLSGNTTGIYLLTIRTNSSVIRKKLMLK